MTSKLSSLGGKVKGAVQYTIKLIVSLLLLIIFTPIAVLIYLLNEFIRRAIITPLLKVHSGGKLKIVSDGSDNIFSFKKHGNSRNILILTVYKDPIDPEKYGQNFLKRVINYEGPNGAQPYNKLKQIYTKKFGYHCWKDHSAEFNIRDHIRVVDESWWDGNNENTDGKNNLQPSSIKITGPDSTTNKTIITESGAMKLLSELTKDMDESRPQWEEIIIPNFVYDHELENYQNGNSNLKTMNHGQPMTSMLKSGSKIRSARQIKHIFLSNLLLMVELVIKAL